MNQASSAEQLPIKPETLTKVLSNMLGTKVFHADYQSNQLHGGTVGDVWLVTGTAEIAKAANRRIVLF